MFMQAETPWGDRGGVRRKVESKKRTSAWRQPLSYVVQRFSAFPDLYQKKLHGVLTWK
jgi:hypothetical protein